MSIQTQKKLHYKPWKVIAACYIGAAAAFLLWHAFLWAADTAAYASGGLRVCQAPLADFELQGMEEAEDGALVTTSADPQMIYRGSEELRSLTVLFAYERPPEETAVFAKKASETDYSLNGQVFGRLLKDGSLFYRFPRGTAAFRIDPDILPGTRLKLESATLNVRQPLRAYLWPTSVQWFFLALLPGMAAAAFTVFAETVFGRAESGPEKEAER